MLLLIWLLSLVLALVLYYHRVYIRFTKHGAKNLTPISILTDMVMTIFHLKHFFRNIKRSFISFPVKKSILIDTPAVNGYDIQTTQSPKSWRDIPGPSSLPIIGPMLNFFPGGVLAGYEGFELSKQVYKLYGPIARIDGIFGKLNMVWLYDAKAVEFVYRSEYSMPVRPGFESLTYYRKIFKKNREPHQLTGLVTEHGENWKKFRSKVNHIMLQTITIKLYKNALAEVADDMVQRIRMIRDENNMIKENFDDEMNLWALESVGLVALGTRLNCFDPNLPKDSEARKLIQNVHDFFITAGKVDFGPSPWRYFSTPSFRKAMEINENLESLTRSFINKAMKNLEESKKVGNFTCSSEKSILEKLLDIDVQVAHTMASDMMVAGVDTTSNTVTSVLYLLATNPEKQNKLREEILAKQNHQKYLKACIKEAMRVMPVVHGNARLTTKECNLLGYTIPKDVVVVICHQFMSSLEEHYPKPDEFIPERWLVGKDDPLYHNNVHPFVTGSFGFGVRMCIGRRIAELDMETFISKVIENFQVEWDGPPPNVFSTTINYIKGPFNFIFKDL